MESLVGLVEEERRKQAFSRVLRVRLRVGALGHVEPEALRFCFDAVISGTIADGARLEIETVPGEGWCAGCRQTVPMLDRWQACPACDYAPVQMTAGDELRLAELEVV